MWEKVSVLFILFLIGCTVQPETKTIPSTGIPLTKTNIEVISMKLTSSVFQPNGKIPSKYTCDGQNINPPLEISDVPAKAKSLVLLMDDPDIPEAAKKNFHVEVWDHWVVFNIPSDTKTITEGKNPPGTLGRNTRGNNTYGGPCPPDREHRYFFKLYALDTRLGLKEGATKAEVEQAMAGHIIAQTELMGKYERVK